VKHLASTIIVGGGTAALAILDPMTQHRSLAQYYQDMEVAAAQHPDWAVEGGGSYTCTNTKSAENTPDKLVAWYPAL
jgi:hypothetical protein